MAVIMKAPLISLGLISATALAYEVLLMRLFSIIQWHHFAYMIISLALLGYGVSGTLVSIFQNTLKSHFRISYPFFLIMFSLTSVTCFLIAQSLDFNPEAILWDSRQVIYLLSIFLLLSIPFLLAASAICLVFLQYPTIIAQTYSVDLLGAGLGSLTVIGLLFFFQPLHALLFISLSGLTSFYIAIKETRPEKQSNKTIMFITILFSLVLLTTTPFWSLQTSPYKDLSKTLNIKGTEIIEQRSSPLGLLDIVKSPQVPFRHAPGLSLYNHHEPLEQLGLFTDAANMTAITRYPQQLEQLAYMDQITSALPYHLQTIKKLLIVGAGGGGDILQALYHQTEQIEAVELNHQIIELMNGPYAEYSGQLFQKDNVQVHDQEIRGFLTSRNIDKSGKYDLIQISLMDSFNASASGLYALNESYLYTVEAFQTYLQHLNPGGYLAISRWVKTPPRDTIKLFATGIDALQEKLTDTVDKQLILIRSWQTSTLLIKPTPFNEDEIKQLKQFTKRRGFDLVWYPGIQDNEVNRFNRIREPWFYQAARQLLNDKQKNEFISQYKYTITPASDDKPFFHHFFKWSSLEELLSLRNQGGLMLVEMGYMVVLSTLFLAIISSIILILLPLLFFYFRSDQNRSFNLSTTGHLLLFSYFFAIGLAFLFIEIAIMQKMILFLHHPIYAIPVVLSAFLVFAGFGSAWTQKLLSRYHARQLLFTSIISLLTISGIFWLIIEPLFNHITAYPIIVKILISLIVIAPMAFCMGMPMPLALSQLSKTHSNYIPWAWGINGCASVISAVLASLLAIHFGFNMVIAAGLLLYLFCLVSFNYFSYYH